MLLINDYDWVRGHTGAVQANVGVAWPQLCPTLGHMVLIPSSESLICVRRGSKEQRRAGGPLSDWCTHSHIADLALKCERTYPISPSVIKVCYFILFHISFSQFLS